MPEPILVAIVGKERLSILPKLANRHGLIAGATGTGKTVTLQTLAESFSRIGVPTFLADVKGDLAGLSQAGGNNPRIVERLKELGQDKRPFAACPVTFWDVYGEQGHPVRTTVADMGPLLLARLLNLNEIQEGVLALTFKVADANGQLLLDYKDLRAMLQYVAENAKELTTEYGNISAASVGAIQRSLLALEQQGGDKFFGEPALDLMDFIQTNPKGQGFVNILAADKLLNSPKVYATFLLWMLSKLFDRLPEVGDPEKPKLVFFFDEAHLLFDDAPEVLLSKIEQVVRLIRSKGVGVYFITQVPTDVPDKVLSQLGNRVQHGLRAFTPREQKFLTSTAASFRDNPKLNEKEVLTKLGVGEALVSFLEESGTPAIVQQALIVPPTSRVGPISPAERNTVMSQSIVVGQYEKVVDRESAYEILKGRTAKETEEAAKTAEERSKALAEKQAAKERERAEKEAAKQAREAEKAAKTSVTGKVSSGILTAIIRGLTNAISAIVRGIVNNLLKGKKGR
jgi:DNA helicase HerA-like ATPase